eukprot:17235_1
MNTMITVAATMATLLILGKAAEDCSYPQSCWWATIDGDADCSGEWSCEDATIGGDADCSGEWSCLSATIHGSANCGGAHACYDATMHGSANCGGYDSCNHARMHGDAAADCSGEDSCNYAIYIVPTPVPTPVPIPPTPPLVNNAGNNDRKEDAHSWINDDTHNVEYGIWIGCGIMFIIVVALCAIIFCVFRKKKYGYEISNTPTTTNLENQEEDNNLNDTDVSDTEH